MNLIAALLATVLSLSGEWEFRRAGGSWEKVQVPHDWAIAGPFDPDGDPDTGKLPWRGKGEYRKKVKVGGEGEERNLRYYLCFDGVMARPEVFVNGEKAGGWDYGYAPFELDVTKFIRPGENEIVVRCDTAKQRSRWYPGAGIYRNVRLETVGTDDVIPNTMRIVATLDGKVEVSYRTPKGERRDSFAVKDPVLWSPENPHLYAYEVNGRKFRYGFRSIEFTADDGFHLNGRRFQIRGVNLHSDLGPLGMAFDRDAAERQLRIMMEMGANAIRTAHNPPAAELLDLCDELGLIVWEELFDKWEDTAGRLPDEDLIEYISRNTKTAVRRDRNHPCVVVWSLGDEIPYGPDEDPSGMTRERLATLRAALREEDATRPVGTGNNRKTMRADVFRDLDLTGWNYRHSYAAIREAIPEKPIVYSESASCVSENGWYDMLAPTGKLDTAYDRFRIDGHECNAPTWADVPEVEFLRMERDRFVAGEFVWTGIDYLGEPSPYSSWYLTTRAKRPPITNAQSSRSSYFGICDLCGFPKDRYWIYRAHWRKDVHTLRLLPHWNWEGQEGKDVDVTVITDCDEAELLLDGRSFGRKTREPVPADYPLHHVTNSPTYYDATRLCRYRWRIPYRPGRLTARGYADGRIGIAADTVTAGKPEKLLLVPERCIGRLEYVQVHAADGKGVAHPLADNRVRFRVEGPGEIAAVCNGDARDLDSFKADGIRLFGGKAQVIVRRMGPGVIRLTAFSPGLADANLESTRFLNEKGEF